MKYFQYTVLFFLITVPTYTQTINATLLEVNASANSDPKGLEKAGDKLYFTADDGIHGKELWMHNTVTNSTAMVKDICPGTNGMGFSDDLKAIGDIVYFNANDGIHGAELWRSDGTAVGTYMVKDIKPTGSSQPYNLMVFNGKLLFTASDSTFGNELFVSDGTSAGTVLLNDIFTGLGSSQPSSLCQLGDLVFFYAFQIDGERLWKTDGTPEGTLPVKDINDEGVRLSYGGRFLAFRNHIYFFAYEDHTGFELWKSDGTQAGTALVKDINPGAASSSETLIGTATDDYFVFRAKTPEVGKELWKSDGTRDGTVFLKDLSPYSIEWDSEQFVTLNNIAYFSGAHNREPNICLWKTDGTSDGTQVLASGSEISHPRKLSVIDDIILFQASGKMWKTDGTIQGTVVAHQIPVDSSTSSNNLHFTPIGEHIYFQAGNRTLTGTELYKTDRMAANIEIVKDINHSTGSGVQNPKGDRFNTVFEYKMLFVGNDMITGDQFYITNGTPDNTLQIKGVDSNPFYIMKDPNVSDRPLPHPTAVGDKVFFTAITSNEGFEPFVAETSEASAKLLKDIFPGFSSSIRMPFFVSYNGIFYFDAENEEHGIELWRSDGTVSGTYMLKDIYQGAYSGIYSENINTCDDDYSNAKSYVIYNGLLYFAAYDEDDASIWRTDGTENGTVKVITLPSNRNYHANPTIMDVANGRFFFSTNTDNSYLGNHSLWSSDGTQQGTIQLDYIATGSDQFKKTAVVNDVFYYTVFEDLKPVLKKSDGTAAGTVTVRENFTEYNMFTELTPCGDHLYFSVGNDLNPAKELWRTDGTVEGTVIVDQISANDSQHIYSCTCVLDNLFYYRQLLAKEIYMVNNSSAIAVPVNVNVVNGAQFLASTEGITTITGLSAFNNKLIMQGTTAESGLELYVGNVEALLATNSFTNPLASKYKTIVYPNPSIGRIIVESTAKELISDVKVYNMLGFQVYDPTIDASSTVSLNIGHLSKGIYMIRIKTGSGLETKKVILE